MNESAPAYAICRNFRRDVGRVSLTVRKIYSITSWVSKLQLPRQAKYIHEWLHKQKSANLIWTARSGEFILTDFSSISNCSPTKAWSANAFQPCRVSIAAWQSRGKQILTQNLLQLHDTGVCTNAMDCLRLLGVLALFEHLAVGAIGSMEVCHSCGELQMERLKGIASVDDCRRVVSYAGALRPS
jgi:hypothetical protein